MKISLKSLSVAYFRSFGLVQKIEFDRNGLLQIKALEFNGSLSGIGKSNLLKALNYGITQGEIKDSGKNWFSSDSDKILVEIELYHDEDIWRIKRGTFTTELYINNKRIEGGAKVINEKIRKLFGLDLDLINDLCFRRQRKGNGFIQATDSERKEFLSRILGLEKIDELIKTSNDVVKKIEILIEQERLQNSGFLKDLSELKTPDEINTNEIGYLKIQLNKNEDLLFKAQKELEERSQLKIELENIFKEKSIQLTAPIILKTEAKEKFELASKPIQDKIKENLDIQKDLNERFLSKVLSIENVNASLASKIEAQTKNLCSECGRTWPGAEEALVQNRALYQENVVFLKKAEDAYRLHLIKEELIQNSKRLLDKLESEYKQDIQKLDFDYKSRKSILDNELNDKISDLKLDVIKDGISDLNKVIFDIKLKINELNNKQKIYESKLADYNKNKLNLETKIKKTENNLVQFQIAAALEEDFKELLGRKGFLGMITGEILSEISGVINTILCKIPNVSEVTCEINPILENDTSIKPKINFNIYKKGIKIGVNDLSGGQISALEIAMDLALNKVIFRRLGIEIGWMIFDEAFNGLSFVDKQAVFELLKQESAQKLILVVDHDSNFENYFSDRITLSYDGFVTTVIS
jgi:DNA repair exonuclease SbcCD ATPase subunit